MKHTWEGVEEEFKKLRSEGLISVGEKGEQGDKGETGDAGPEGKQGPIAPLRPQLEEAIAKEVAKQLAAAQG